MSANNYIHIDRNNRVTMRDADTNDSYAAYTKQCDSLEAAVRYAQGLCDAEMVEYGINFERRTPEEPLPSLTQKEAGE